MQREQLTPCVSCSLRETGGHRRIHSNRRPRISHKSTAIAGRPVRAICSSFGAKRRVKGSEVEQMSGFSIQLKGQAVLARSKVRAILARSKVRTMLGQVKGQSCAGQFKGQGI